jgi:hypothetical protein
MPYDCSSEAAIDDRSLMLSYPCRWKYDILRALDWFARNSRPHDPRMTAALEVVARKRRHDGTWPVQDKHPGTVHFDMEASGGPSRWNTLRAARVIAAYQKDDFMESNARRRLSKQFQ